MVLWISADVTRVRVRPVGLADVTWVRLRIGSMGQCSRVSWHDAFCMCNAYKVPRVWQGYGQGAMARGLRSDGGLFSQ